MPVTYNLIQNIKRKLVSIQAQQKHLKQIENLIKCDLNNLYFQNKQQIKENEANKLIELKKKVSLQKMKKASFPSGC